MRTKVILVCEECLSRNYTTTKNPQKNTERIELKKYCNDKNCTYLDMYSLLEDKDGNLKLEYTREGLHMSDKGYEVITKELKKYMHK